VWGLALGSASYNYTFYLLLTWCPYLIFPPHCTWICFNQRSIPVCPGCRHLHRPCRGGWLVDTLIQRGWSAVRVRQIVLIGGTTLGLGILGTARTHSLSPHFSGSAFLSADCPPLAVGWSIPSLIAPRESVGTLGGILIFAISSPESRRPFSLATSCNRRILFLERSLPPRPFWSGIAGYIFLLGRIEPIPDPA